MSDAQFEKIVKLTQVKRVEEATKEEADLAVGDTLEVCEGPFKGMKGPLLEVSEDDDAYWLLTLRKEAGEVGLEEQLHLRRVVQRGVELE